MLAIEAGGLWGFRAAHSHNQQSGEVSMFEYDQEIVESLLNGDERFQELYKRHHELKERVRDAELGVTPLDDFTLGAMKKEKLLAKDQMAAIIATYRRNQSATHT